MSSDTVDNGAGSPHEHNVAADLVREARACLRTTPDHAGHLASAALDAASVCGDVVTACDAHMLLFELARIGMRFDTAREHADAVEALLAKIDDPLRQVKFLHVRGIFEMTLEREACAVEIFEQGLEYARRHGLKRQRVDLLISLGYAHSASHRHMEAFRCLLDAEELAPEDPSLCGRIFTGLGFLFSVMREFEGADEYYRRAYELHCLTGNRVSEAYALLNIAAVLMSRRQWQEALGYLYDGMRIAEEVGFLRLLPNLLYNIGAALTELGDLPRAMQHLRRAEEITRIGAQWETRSKIMTSIGIAHRHAGDYPGAETALAEALEIAMSREDHALLALIHEEIASVMELKGDMPQALRHLRHVLAERAHMETSNELREILELYARAKRSALEAEHDTLRFRTQLLESEQLRNRRELMSMALDLARKNEVLDQLAVRLAGENGTPEGVRALAMSIREELNGDEQWKQFEQKFAMQHPGFVSSLTGRAPVLTPTEIRICTLLRIDFTSKEIASILGVSVHTVNTHRFRLRRKLGMAASESLPAFLMALT